jgi:N-glycosylase/DNA lyase
MQLIAAGSRGEMSLPTLLVNEYRRLSKEFEQKKSWRDMSEQELWNESCFCILSSNVPFEMAKSAYLQLLAKNLLDLRCFGRRSEKNIVKELSRPVFLPRRKDGSMRKFRFAAIRARNIVGAWNCLYGSSTTIHQVLSQHGSGEEARRFLAQLVPGLGMKESSHFLRNIKFSDSLAILDSHILNFLSMSALVGQQLPNGLTPRRYVQIEQIMKAVAENCGMSLGILDMAIWEFSRSN